MIFQCDSDKNINKNNAKFATIKPTITDKDLSIQTVNDLKTNIAFIIYIVYNI